jgi:tripartite ATP-independent transporter DctM subunit
LTLALFSAFLVGLAIGLPVALTMGISSVASILATGEYPLIILPQRLFAGIDSFPLMAVPLFILATDFMTAGKLTDAILGFSNALVGHIRGGFGHVNVLSSMFFAGISGSALADAAGPGAIEMEMMTRNGYPNYYSGAMTAASAVIGPIIPPSIIMIVYAVSESHVTVSGLFMAGIVPGILLGLALAITHHVISLRKGYQPPSKRPPVMAVLKSFLYALPGLMMPVIILGGILGGIFTATEAAAVAVFYALVIGLFVTRGLNWSNIPKIFVNSAIVTAAVLLIVSMASAFSWLLTVLQVPQNVANLLAGVSTDRVVILILINLFILVCGMFIDTLPAVIILTPVLAPVAINFGIDPHHFGIILTLNLAIGMITPPVGPVLFVVSTVGKLRLEKLSSAVMPLLMAELVVLVLVSAIPALTLTVPRLLGVIR